MPISQAFHHDFLITSDPRGQRREAARPHCVVRFSTVSQNSLRYSRPQNLWVCEKDRQPPKSSGFEHHPQNNLGPLEALLAFAKEEVKKRHIHTGASEMGERIWDGGTPKKIVSKKISLKMDDGARGAPILANLHMARHYQWGMYKGRTFRSAAGRSEFTQG